MKMCSGRLALFFILLGYWLSPALAQRLVYTTYTTDQGLPGNYVYASIQDHKGYMWFATDVGVCRFDGYEFVSPVDTSAARGSEAFLVTEDSKGTIWFTRLDGSLWYIEQDTTRAWKHNQVIAGLTENVMIIEKMAIAQDGVVWLAVRRLGLVSVDTSGQHKLHAQLESYPAFVFTEVRGKVLFTTQLGLCYPYLLSSKTKVVNWRDGKMEVYTDFSISPTPQDKEAGVWRLRNGDWLFSASGRFYLVRDQQVLWGVESGIVAEDVLETSDGEILVAALLGSNTGLFRFSSLEDLRHNHYKHLLPSHFVADINEDFQGGWWISLLNGGVMHCKNPHLEVFDIDDGLPSNQVCCLAHNGGDTLFAGISPKDVVLMNVPTESITLLPMPGAEQVEILLYEMDKQRLWCGNFLSYFKDGIWHQLKIPGFPMKSFVAKKIFRDPATNALWLSTTYGFGRLNTVEGSYERYEASFRTFSVTLDHENNLWVTTNDGLRVWKHGHYQTLPFDHPALRYQPRDVVMLPDGGMAIGLRSAGILIRSADGTLTHFTEQDGLASDFITKLYCSPEGVLFACSNAGVSRLSPRPENTWELVAIDIKSGLPSNKINDVITQGNSIWLATNMGLVRLRDFPRSNPMPAPILERMQINNRPVAFQSSMELSHSENSITIRFVSLHYRSAGDILYRYRLLQTSNEFQYTKSRDVNYANLQPGTYTFEVQAQNEARQWSSATQFSFVINPAWWRASWFYATLTLLLTGIVALGYRRYVQEQRRETEIKMKIRELESTALRAQMNPHFLFNSLNSIQNYIAENDSESATRYLGRFAKLVRLALHGSVDGQHSLLEEIEMLDSYLALEQLRFRERFTYSIDVSPDLDIDELSLPPLLVQPFVENALLHGMKNKTEGGRISVVFTTEADYLVATVTDNGPGFEIHRRGSAAEQGYRSVGMMLTQQRLALLSDSADGNAFTRENIVAEDGTVLGTRVRLRI